MKYTVETTYEYRKWYKTNDIKSKFQIEKRLRIIRTEGLFGTIRWVSDDVCELKWRNGRRIYFAKVEDDNVLLLLGGNKNGQDQDINQAKKYSESAQKMKIKKGCGVMPHDPIQQLSDETFIKEVIWQCLRDGDPQGAVEALEEHIMVKNISKMDVPRTTVYRALSEKKPTLETFSKILHAVIA